MSVDFNIFEKVFFMRKNEKIIDLFLVIVYNN